MNRSILRNEPALTLTLAAIAVATAIVYLTALANGLHEFFTHGNLAEAVSSSVLIMIGGTQVAGFAVVVMFVCFFATTIPFSRTTIQEIVHFLRFVIVGEGLLYIAYKFIQGVDIESAIYLTALAFAFWVIFIYIFLYASWALQKSFSYLMRKSERS